MAYISIHSVSTLFADAGGTQGAPLSIRVYGASATDEVTLFTDDIDLSRKLADAINATVDEHRKSKWEAA